MVDAANPLPIAATLVAAGSIPLTGTLSLSSLAGPFAPQLGRPIWLALSGTWTGSVRLLRSSDGGATKLPLTYGDGTPKPSWTGACHAPVAEESVAGASYWLDATLTGGAVQYRLEQ